MFSFTWQEFGDVCLIVVETEFRFFFFRSTNFGSSVISSVYVVKSDLEGESEPDGN